MILDPIDQFYVAFCLGMATGWLITFQYSRRPRQGSNPPSPGRKPTPPAGPPSYGWGLRQLPPPPPAPGMRREYICNPAQMAECGGPCWETRDPSYCVCGALWRDVPCQPPAFTEGRVQRGQGNGGPTTEKPAIVAKPQPHGGRLLRPWE